VAWWVGMITPTHDPAQLRERADEARTEAGLTADPIIREALLTIANEYEELAALAEVKTTKANDAK
jgi:hypothetical protein